MDDTPETLSGCRGGSVDARSFLSRMWHLGNAERPGFMFGYVGPRVKRGAPIRSALFSTEGVGTVRDRLRDAGKFLDAQIKENEAVTALPGDVVPSVCPAFGVVGIPSAFGCEVVWWEDQLPAVRPFAGLDPGRILEMKKPSFHDGELGRVLNYTSEFLQKTGGGVPVRLTDIQGPLDSAALVVGHTEFLSLLTMHPAAAHHLLRLVTEFTIDLVRAQREIVRRAGVEFVPSMFQPWIPDGLGVSVANDESVMISAAMHDEFSVPYINILSEEFGGVIIHCCGNWVHQFKSLDKVRHLRGLEFGASEAPFESVLDYFGGRTVLACRVGLHRDVHFAGMQDYVARVLQTSRTFRGLFINVDITNGIVDETWPETDIEEIARMITSVTGKG
jgi:hypothetical protein